MPKPLQDEVYRTVKLRGPNTDASWAPWWRAQAQAIHAVQVAGVHSGRWIVKRPGILDERLKKDLAFADYLDGTITGDQLQAARGY